MFRGGPGQGRRVIGKARWSVGGWRGRAIPLHGEAVGAGLGQPVRELVLADVGMARHPEQKDSGHQFEGLDFVSNMVDEMTVGLGPPLALGHAERVPIVAEEDIGGVAVGRVRHGPEGVVAVRGEALELRDVVGGNSQGDAAQEDARVVPEGGDAGSGRTWVSQRGAIGEVLGS